MYGVGSGSRTPKGSGGGAGNGMGSGAMTPMNSGFKSPRAAVRQERQTNFKVVIRVRPPLPRELNGDPPFRNVIAVDDREQTITVSENIDAVVEADGSALANPGPYTTYSFTFDYVYGMQCSQEKVYETTARHVVDSALQGYNATIFAYGQTGAGKTYTMEGFNREGNIESRGIIPRAIEQIFGHIQVHASSRKRFLVRASYLQIYNEQISDLLKPERNNLSIREDKKRGVYVDGLSEWVVRSPAEIYGLMERGGAVRATGETKMNEMSSRSHAVFIVIAEQSETVYVDDHGVEMNGEEFQKFIHQRGVRREQEMSRLEDNVRQTFKVGKLNLVDLAGSERVQRSGATGQRLEESKQINRSLSMLGYVISALTEAKDRQHVPYRNSKLTRMLEDSLGGNCKTTMMAMVSPAFEAMLETISTLKFANRAKNIRNEARVNEDLDQKSLLRKYERELKKLRAELEERSKNVVDKRRLLELDEQRRRAEADKMAAIRALEARSLEFMQEKEEKKKLEQRIAMLMNQMIRGERPAPGMVGMPGSPGGGVVEGDEAAFELKEAQERLRQEYESKLSNLERERESIEEEKAQVDRYKQLLLKQRDIMIALTQRLVERDEQIMALQDELDAYDRHHKELEEKLDEKTAALIKFQRISMEASASSPQKQEELRRAMEAWDVQENGGNSKVGSTAGSQGSVPGVRGPTEILTSPVEDDVQSNVFMYERQDGSTGKAESSSPSTEVLQLNHVIDSLRGRIASLERSLEESHESAKDGLASLKGFPLEHFLETESEKYIINLPDHVRGPLRESIQAVFSQISRRINASGGNVKTALEDDLNRLREENSRLRSSLTQQAIHGSADTAITGLRSKVESLTKEREAVQTIMEHKIKVLVQSVAQAAGAIVTNNTTLQDTPAGVALTKDLTALQRLVNASIAALKNAANQQSATAGVGSSSVGGSLVSPPTRAYGVAPNGASPLDGNGPPPPPPLGSSTSSSSIAGITTAAAPSLRSSFSQGSSTSVSSSTPRTVTFAPDIVLGAPSTGSRLSSSSSVGSAANNSTSSGYRPPSGNYMQSLPSWDA